MLCGGYGRQPDYAINGVRIPKRAGVPLPASTSICADSPLRDLVPVWMPVADRIPKYRSGRLTGNRYPMRVDTTSHSITRAAARHSASLRVLWPRPMIFIVNGMQKSLSMVIIVQKIFFIKYLLVWRRNVGSGQGNPGPGWRNLKPRASCTRDPVPCSPVLVIVMPVIERNSQGGKSACPVPYPSHVKMIGSSLL